MDIDRVSSKGEPNDSECVCYSSGDTACSPSPGTLNLIDAISQTMSTEQIIFDLHRLQLAFRQ